MKIKGTFKDNTQEDPVWEEIMNGYLAWLRYKAKMDHFSTLWNVTDGILAKLSLKNVLIKGNFYFAI